ncbi:RNA 2'-phosphotransferase [Haloarcula salina]|uniref:Probable RNA 2'-phosphotransferase n=1 Tax=Haloarcula salina TaxID=1429914 RepID=A0AA41FXE6_9EURY|nr:RNA 2'-phosphotransferase [Haloarcula salina]MBV0900575.1 RNA 2'-phosphotransferase [Haloarcula salina]
MPDAIRRCPDHGFFEGAACPTCDAPGAHVLEGERRRRLSKFVSGALRHFPDDAGIELDSSGWTPFPALADAVARRYDWADADALAGVVATDPKGRFERTGGETADWVAETADPSGETADPAAATTDDRIRAAYGHSVDVSLGATAAPVPETLYHGTAPRNVASIRDGGLEPMSRQTVHLSGSVDEAEAVGRRHADDPVVFAVDAAAMGADGLRVAKRGTGTYTTDGVPPRYLDLLDDA